MEIRPENTAIINGVAKSAIELAKRTNTTGKVLDYGSGRLRNASYLKRKGFNVSVLDTDFQIQRANNDELDSYEDVFTIETYIPHEEFDSVLCSFVLNVIPEVEERERALESIHKSLKDTGELFLEVRRDKGILKNKYKEPYKDGYVIGKNQIKTFQKPYESEEITKLLKKGFRIEKIALLSDSVLAIATKK